MGYDNASKLGEIMKAVFLLPSLLILTACTTTTTTKPQSNVTPPTVVRPPDLTKLSAKSCQGGEIITTPVRLRLDETGAVTDVVGVILRDKELTRQIVNEFKKSKYTPYMKNGKPVAHHLDVAIHLRCPQR